MVLGRQNEATEIKLRAERKAGEMLAEMELNVGGRPLETSNTELLVSPPRLEDLGITKMQSSRWQRQARIPEETSAKHGKNSKTPIGVFRSGVAVSAKKNSRRW